MSYRKFKDELISKYTNGTSHDGGANEARGILAVTDDVYEDMQSHVEDNDQLSFNLLWKVYDLRRQLENALSDLSAGLDNPEYLEAALKEFKEYIEELKRL